METESLIVIVVSIVLFVLWESMGVLNVLFKRYGPSWYRSLFIISEAKYHVRSQIVRKVDNALYDKNDESELATKLREIIDARSDQLEKDPCIYFVAPWNHHPIDIEINHHL